MRVEGQEGGRRTIWRRTDEKVWNGAGWMCWNVAQNGDAWSDKMHPLV